MFEKKSENFRDNSKVFSKTISEFRELTSFKKINSKNVEKYFGIFQKYYRNFLRIILKIFKKNSENFENLFHKISTNNISEGFEKYHGYFQEAIIGKLREVLLKKILDNI